MKRNRKLFTASEKMTPLRRHLIDKVAVSAICEEAQLQPIVFYRWLQQLFENGAAALERSNTAPERPDLKARRRIAQLEDRLRTKDNILAELMEEHVALKNSRGERWSGQWVTPETRDQVVDFVRQPILRTEIPVQRFVRWLALAASQFFDWRTRYGQGNEHNAWVPRDHWLAPTARNAIIVYYGEHPDEGYCRVTNMMLDTNVVAVSPSTTYRVLGEAGLLRAWNRSPSKKGTGFQQPLAPHEHWHVDIA